MKDCRSSCVSTTELQIKVSWKQCSSWKSKKFKKSLHLMERKRLVYCTYEWFIYCPQGSEKMPNFVTPLFKDISKLEMVEISRRRKFVWKNQSCIQFVLPSTDVRQNCYQKMIKLNKFWVTWYVNHVSTTSDKIFCQN